MENKPLHILMLATSYPKYAGEATAPFIEEIAAGMVRRGHSVDVLLPEHPELRRASIERGVRLHMFHYSPWRKLQVWGYAAALQADVGLKGAALAVAPLALTASLAALWRLTGQQQYDLIHAHWVLPNGLPAAAVAELRGLPLVVSMHGSDVFMAEKALPFSLATKLIFARSGGITACSSELHERALRLGASPTCTQTLPYGVDTQLFKPDAAAAQRARNLLGVGQDVALIVSISRLVYKKGLSYLLEGFAQLASIYPNTMLVLGGYGDLREELEQRAQALGIGAHVCFPGQLSREDAAALMAAADVYVVPSIRDQAGNVDGLPNVLLEAMSTACPIVASRLAGIPNVISHELHGLLVPERDANALAQAVARVLDERVFAQRLGAAARQRVLDELTWDCTAERFEGVYRRALRNHE